MTYFSVPAINFSKVSLFSMLRNIERNFTTVLRRSSIVLSKPLRAFLGRLARALRFESAEGGLSIGPP